MANREKGEVSFEASGKTWTLKMGTNAWCLVESELGVDMSKIDLNDLSMTRTRVFFWATLRHHHKDVSVEQAGELMDDIGTARSVQLMTEALALQAPEAKAGDARPPKAAAV